MKIVTITKHGSKRTALVSVEERARLKRRARRAIAAGELTDQQIVALREAKVPDQHADLDCDLTDWER